MKRILVLLFLISLSSCAGGIIHTGTDTSVAFTPSPSNTIISPTAEITANFSNDITEPSDWSSAFTVKKDNQGDTICTQITYANRVATCMRDDDLEWDTSYTASVNVLDSNGWEVHGEDAFRTSLPVTLERLDGTDLNLTDRPIPTVIRVKFSFRDPITDQLKRTSFEDSVGLLDASGNSVTGTYEWSADSLSVLFAPNDRLFFASTYTVRFSTVAASISSLTKAIGDSLMFTTATDKDVDGDGYADFVTGTVSPLPDSKAYLFYGSESGIADCDLSAGCMPDTIFSGVNPNDQFSCCSTLIIGDVNADGYADISINAVDYPNGNVNGASYIFHGVPTRVATCDLSNGCVASATIVGANNNDELGNSSSSAGDVNGDGYDDVLISATGYPAGAQKGRTYVFYGSANGIGDCDLGAGCVADVTITGESNSDYLGYPGSSAGDVNGDGYDDILATSFQYPSGLSKGRSYMFLGSEGGIPDCDLSAGCTADATFTGENELDLFGVGIQGVGDVNGDGFDDIVMGALFFPLAGSRGKAYLFYGSEGGIADCDLSATCTADADFIGESLADFFGFIITKAGDINGDGFDDLLIGAGGAPSASNRGQAYIFLGSQSGISSCDLSTGCTADATITAFTGTNFFGDSGYSGDVNGDGYNDVMVGGSGYPTGLLRGIATIFEGSESGIADCDLSGTCVPDTTLSGAFDGDRFGIMQ